MFLIHRFGLCACVAGYLLAMPGCGPKAASTSPQPYPVKGKVALQGDLPVGGAQVTLHPLFVDKKIQRFQGWGFTKADGSFYISAFKDGDGVAPGRYKLTIAPREDGPSVGGNVEKIPARYTDESTTPWTVEVLPMPNDLGVKVLD